MLDALKWPSAIVMDHLRNEWKFTLDLLRPSPSPRSLTPHLLRYVASRLENAIDHPKKASAARHLPKDALHPAIREDVWSLCHRARYDTAVFEAMKAVRLRCAMRIAFAPEGGQ